MQNLGVLSLGSGSKGNATLVRFSTTLLLVDNGYSCKELEARLFARGIKPEEITAVLVTHEHGDHFNGVPALSNKYKIPVWMSPGTSLHPKASKLKNLNLFNNHQPFKLGEINILPVTVPHDSREASQFTFEANQQKVGILTDIGHVTPYVVEQYRDCDILLLEFNHDFELLMNGVYPDKLKARVGGRFGHLSNQQACEFLREDIKQRLKYLVAMHVSEENNRPEIVLQSIESTKLGEQVEVSIAHQKKGFDWINL